MPKHKFTTRTLACVFFALVASCADAGPTEPTAARPQAPSFNGIGWMGGGGRSDSTVSTSSENGIGWVGGGGRLQESSISVPTTTAVPTATTTGVGVFGGGGRTDSTATTTTTSTSSNGGIGVFGGGG